MDRFTFAVITIIIAIMIACYKRTKEDKQDAIFWMLVAILDAICAFLIKYQQVNNLL